MRAAFFSVSITSPIAAFVGFGHAISLGTLIPAFHIFCRKAANDSLPRRGKQQSTMSLLSVGLGAFLLLILSTIFYSGFCLCRSYVAARKIGVPIRIILVDHNNPLWLVVDRFVLSILKTLPGWLGNNSFTRYNYHGWEVPDRYYSHHEMGGAYIMISSANVWFYFSDPDAVIEFWRRKEFIRETSVTGP